MKEQSTVPRYPMTGEAGAFFHEVLGSRFDFSDIRAVLPSRTFDRELMLRVGSKEVRLLEMGPAHTRFHLSLESFSQSMYPNAD